jgi:galactose mutarotase-like enzyme
MELVSNQIKVIVIPELGGKIVSLLYKPTGKEWLVDAGSRELRPVPYGADFAKADMSGWDECFPTINVCSYPADGSHKGKLLPDHGELWCIPWTCSAEPNTLVCRAEGRALPYTFTRKLRFISENKLRFDYEVTNTGGEGEPLSVLWTAHPQFAVTEHTRIELPESITELLVVNGGSRLERGKLYRWPDGDDAANPLQLNRIGPAARQDCRKLYADGPVAEGWAGLAEADSGEMLRLEWPIEQVSYLGIWIDESLVNDRPVCALEPSNGFYDSLEEAYRRDRLLRIGSGETACWHLDVELGHRSIH